MSSAPLISSPSFTRSGNSARYRLSNTRLPAGVLLCGLLLAGCAGTPGTRALLTTPSADLPPGHEIEQAAFFPQTRYQCGPAALATVLVTHGIDVTPESLVDQVYIPGLRGSLAEEIAATARRYDLLAYPLAPSLADLLAEVANDHPVLVFQNLGLRWLPRWHFAVVVGYDLANRELVLRSGTTRRRRTSLAAFEHTWARGDYWARVILPAGELPATAEPLRYLRAAYDLEQTGRSGAARRAYRAGSRHWPGDPHLWMALGNSDYAAGEFTAATAAFHRAVRLAPDNPSGWNNLAYALLKTHCPQQALRAATCARRAAPDDPAILATAVDIKNLASGRDANRCPVVSCQSMHPAPPPQGDEQGKGGNIK